MTFIDILKKDKINCAKISLYQILFFYKWYYKKKAYMVYKYIKYIARR